MQRRIEDAIPRTSTPASARELLTDLEQLWCMVDECLTAQSVPTESRVKGVGDVDALLSHLVGFDREFVIQGIARGPYVPASEQRRMRTWGEIAAWNARRSVAGQGSAAREHRLRELGAARDAIRRLASDMSESDLERPVWWPLPLSGGWRTARMALESCCSHTWTHVVDQLPATELGGRRRASIASATHRALAHYMRTLTCLLDESRARRIGKLTAMVEFSGPGGGVWTFQLNEGDCHVTEGRPQQADVAIELSPATFLRTVVFSSRGLFSAVVTGDIRVKGSLRTASAFRALFSCPPSERVLDPE